MKALLVKDELKWHRDWSSELGRRLETRDSSNNLLIFGENCTEEEILKIIRVLENFRGVVSLEVFNLENLTRSLSVLSRYFQDIPAEVQ